MNRKPVPLGCGLICAFALTLGQPARGQDTPNTFEPASKPGAGQKFLEKMVGDWTVEKVFYPREGAPVRTTGQCRQTMVQDGKFLQSDFTFLQGDRKTTGLGIIGFEPETGRFTSFWIDSRQTRTSLRQSRESFTGDKIVLFSASLDPQTPETRRSRTVSHLEDNDRRLIHRQYALGGDGSEDRLVMELILTRKP